MKVETNADLYTELSFIPKNTKVFCRNYGLGYQLYFINEQGEEVARIFISPQSFPNLSS